MQRKRVSWCVFVCAGVSVWSVWICWWERARRRRPSKKTRGTATCVAPGAPTGYCGDGTTGPSDYNTSSPTTTNKTLWVWQSTYFHSFQFFIYDEYKMMIINIKTTVFLKNHNTVCERWKTSILCTSVLYDCQIASTKWIRCSKFDIFAILCLPEEWG